MNGLYLSGAVTTRALAFKRWSAGMKSYTYTVFTAAYKAVASLVVAGLCGQAGAATWTDVYYELGNQNTLAGNTYIAPAHITDNSGLPVNTTQNIGKATISAYASPGILKTSVWTIAGVTSQPGGVSDYSFTTTQASFFDGIGVIGLAGVVVNDALVMVAHLNHLKRQYTGRDRTAIIAEGAANRLRPVILTTVTTVAGLLPLTYGIGGEDEMMAPMAMALGYGLFFATPIALILLPCLYLIRDDFAAFFSRVFRRRVRVEFEIERHIMKEVPDGLVLEGAVSYSTKSQQEEIER